MKLESTEQAVQTPGNKESNGKTMHFFNQSTVLFAKADEFTQLLLQGPVFFAECDDLPLRDRDRSAPMRMRYLYIRQHGAIFFKKTGVFPQVLDYLFVVERHVFI